MGVSGEEATWREGEDGERSSHGKGRRVLGPCLLFGRNLFEHRG